MAHTLASAFPLCTKGGDCDTLVRAIEALAEDCLGILAPYKTSADVGFGARFVVPKATTIDGQTGTIDDDAAWLFANHDWIWPLARLLTMVLSDNLRSKPSACRISFRPGSQP